MSNWLIVADSNAADRRATEKILTFNGFKVDSLSSGRELLEFVNDNKPDMIMLDIHMPDIDGVELLKKLRKVKNTRSTPVIFLTANTDDPDTEARALAAGAMDFITKPFAETVLMIRVRHILDLVRLEADLKSEVKIMSGKVIEEHEKNERLSLQVVKTLAGAIDAKDKYTKGHSTRVADYAREIAFQAGKSEKYQEDIYMMGLLHDVGKIGIPDTVINKPSKLTEEEYAVIKTHPVVGYEILRNIDEMPKLAVGARWHHEHYDGTGYPDGLSGKDIPEEARILAVADAYDAMSSRRSYHDVFAQEYIRSELVKNKGTQFDPEFADIMIAMIDADIAYIMREHTPDGGFGLMGSDPQPESSGEMLFSFLSMLEAGGINTAVGIKYCMNEPAFYKEMLNEFAVNARDREALLNAYYTLQEWDRYKTYVHSLKSSSMTIGATSLAEYAGKLEEACKEGDIAFIEENHEVLISKMNSAVGTILMTMSVYGSSADGAI